MHPFVYSATAKFGGQMRPLDAACDRTSREGFALSGKAS